MSHTIDDLLVLSRTGEREGQGEEVDLAEAAADARRRWERAAAARDIALTAEHDGAGSVWASRADLDRAVDAVVENAIHYTPRRRPRDSCAPTARAIEVLDDGPGPRARRGGRGVRAASTAGRRAAAGAPGTGLGLPIARELMRALGRRRRARQPARGRRARDAHRAAPLPALCRPRPTVRRDA